MDNRVALHVLRPDLGELTHSGDTDQRPGNAVPPYASGGPLALGWPLCSFQGGTSGEGQFLLRGSHFTGFLLQIEPER